MECKHPMSSARSNGPGTSSAATSPTKNVHDTPASRARRRALAIARPAKSTPTADHPCRARYTAFVPVPQPRSIARPGACEATKRSTSGGVIPVSQGGRLGIQYQSPNQSRRTRRDYEDRQIGRASCRERVEGSEDGGAGKE